MLLGSPGTLTLEQTDPALAAFLRVGGMLIVGGLPVIGTALAIRTALDGEASTTVRVIAVIGVAASLIPVVSIVVRGAGAWTADVANVVSEGAAAEATSTLPLRMARVIPAEFAGGASLGAPGAAEAWVTAADDLAGISTSEGLASRLTLVDSSGNLIPGARAVIEFDTVTEGLASPVLRDAPGFVGGGFTAGGASEFVMPNLPLSQLLNVTVRIVP
jgi:hypothetical protein